MSDLIPLFIFVSLLRTIDTFLMYRIAMRLIDRFEPSKGQKDQ